jgi:cell division septum initiation protein DivIVA
MKEIGKMVNSDTINHLIDTFQKDMMEKQQLLTSMVNHLESKISSLAKGTESQHNKKELLGKSERKQEKKSSPSKSVEVIQSSLNRLERHILQKQNEEVRRVEKEMDSKIESYDKQLGK